MEQLLERIPGAAHQRTDKQAFAGMPGSGRAGISCPFLAQPGLSGPQHRRRQFLTGLEHTRTPHALPCYWRRRTHKTVWSAQNT